MSTRLFREYERQEIKMRKLLWIFLVLVQCDLWAASAADLAMCGAGGLPPSTLASAGASSAAHERPDSPEDYKPTTLPEAIEFCQSIARDNIIWIEELQKYWEKSENMEAVRTKIREMRPEASMEHINAAVQFMLNAYGTEREDWKSMLGAMGDLVTSGDYNKIHLRLNNMIYTIIVAERDVAVLKHGEDHPGSNIGSCLPGNLKNTTAQWKSLRNIFKVLLPFSSPDYQTDYREAGFESIGTVSTKAGLAALHSEEKCVSEGPWFHIVTTCGKKVTLSLEKSLGFLDQDLLSQEMQNVGIVHYFSKLTITFPSGLEVMLSSLDLGQATKYKQAYMTAKAAKAEFELLATEPQKKLSKKEAKREAARIAAEAAAREAARIAAEAAARETDRKSLAAISLALVGEQKAPPPLKKELGGTATESVPPTHREPIGSIPLKPENQDMLSDLILHAVPARSYDWSHLTNLLGNLGFTRRGTNFVGFDGAGKRKQIGLHYLHGDMSLNPDLVQIMFKQLHGSVGLGRVALGRLAGIAESLPWPWESDRPR